MVRPLVETDQAYVYAIGEPEGPQKIGFSRWPQARAKQLRSGGPKLTVHAEVAVPTAIAREVEALAHWMLRDFALGAERFSVTPTQAQSTIEEAALRHLSGDRAPPDEDACIGRINVTAPESFIRQVEEWRISQRPVLTMAKAVRVLIERAFEAERREKLKPKDLK